MEPSNTNADRADAEPFLPAIARCLWRAGVEPRPVWQNVLIRPGRLAYAVARDLVRGPLTLHASGLVYTTILSFVPLLALSFSILKGLGAHDQLQPLLYRALAPLGESAKQVSDTIIAFVDNVSVGVLGTLGVLLLLYTSISVVQKVETAFNDIWHVTRGRSIGHSIRDYLTLLIIGPILVFVVFGLTASLLGQGILRRFVVYDEVVALLNHFIPDVLIVGVFTTLYKIIPNTRVTLKAAALGALVAGTLWLVAGWGFTAFVARSASYTAIYSAFASLILFLLWLYVNWLILLIGGSIAFYIQNPDYQPIGLVPPLGSVRTQEMIMLATMAEIARAAYRGDQGCTVEALGATLRVPKEGIKSVLTMLQRTGFVAQSADNPPRYLSARPLETTTVAALWQAFRNDVAIDLGSVEGTVDETVNAALACVEQAAFDALDGITVKDLALANAAEFLRVLGTPALRDVAPQEARDVLVPTEMLGDRTPGS
jgi:membrane protein